MNQTNRITVSAVAIERDWAARKVRVHVSHRPQPFSSWWRGGLYEVVTYAPEDYSMAERFARNIAPRYVNPQGESVAQVQRVRTGLY